MRVHAGRFDTKTFKIRRLPVAAKVGYRPFTPHQLVAVRDRGCIDRWLEASGLTRIGVFTSETPMRVNDRCQDAPVSSTGAAINFCGRTSLGPPGVEWSFARLQVVKRSSAGPPTKQ